MATAIIAERIQKVDNSVSAMTDKIAEIKTDFKEKISSLQKDLATQRTEIEKFTGAFDADGDGIVTLKEAAKIVSENKSQWLNIEFWISIILAVFGVNVGGKALSKGKSSLAGRSNESKNIGGAGS